MSLHASPDAWLRLEFVVVFVVALVTCSAILTSELLGPKCGHAWITTRGVSEDLKANGYIVLDYDFRRRHETATVQRLLA